jgi:predicted MFS family arabinose efflux permease
VKTGFAFLVLAYVLSQFFRAFLAVLAPVLGIDIGAEPGDLALASGVWFAVFAAMQIPIGIGLDRIGPRRVAGGLFLLGAGGGAALFALAGSPGTVVLAMALIGAGCAPVLMASFYIFARTYPPAIFASLAGALIGIGSAGNIAATAPLALAVEALGWRGAVWALAAVSVAIGLGLLALIRDPEPPPPAGPAAVSLGSVLRQPAFLLLVPIIIMHYAPAAGIRGLWAGPYLGDVFGLDTAGIGRITFWMAVAMVAGSFAYGPLDRLLGTRKGVVLAGNLALAASLVALAALPAAGVATAGVLLAAIGFFGASFALVMAHGRAFFPPELIGRGVTFINLLAIGGVGLFQVASGALHGAVAARGGPPEAPYQAILLASGILVALACGVYAFARDRLD